MSKSSDLLKGAALFHKAEVMRERADEISKEAKALLGIGNMVCYGHWESSGEENKVHSYNFRIPLPAYLAMFSDAKPTWKTWFSDVAQVQRGKLEYPAQYVGEKSGVALWASAESECVDLTAPAVAKVEPAPIADTADAPTVAA